MFLVLGLFFFFFGIGALAGIVYSFFKWGVPLIILIIQTIVGLVSQVIKVWREHDPAEGIAMGDRWAAKLGLLPPSPEEYAQRMKEARERGDRWAVKLGIKKAPSPAKQAADGGQDT